MYQEYIDELAQSATQELFDIPKISMFKHIKRFIRKNIMGQLVAPIDNINWPKGCLMVGLMASEHYAPVQEYLDQWIKKGAKVYTIDDCLAGQALMQIYQTTENPKYLSAAEKMMDFLYRHDKDSKGSLPYRPLHKTNHIYADGIGMVCPFAIQYGILKKDKKALELAMNQIRNFMKYGIDEKTGLPYHLYKQETEEKLGLLGWGRAVGWISYGIAASIQNLHQTVNNPKAHQTINSLNAQQTATNPQEDKKQIALAESYKQELSTILEKWLQVITQYKTEDGLYTCSLTEKGAPIDTSATAMILYAEYVLLYAEYVLRCTEHVSYGVELPEKFLTYIQKGQVIQAQSECLGIGLYGETFASYPWSVGMTLKLLSDVR